MKSTRNRPTCSTLGLILLFVSIGIIAAMLGGAVFISDGAYFLLQTINKQSVEVPHLRITFSILLYPALLATKFTENFTVIRWIYSLGLMFTPPLALALSWWLVRRKRPGLFVWASLGILLVNLPGQMHWVATSIRTNQLFWPLLLAILIGMPSRAIPVAVILAQLMMVLHPHAAAYFLAGSLAAIWIAWSRPEIRSHMIVVSAVGLFFTTFRLLIPSTDYESNTAGFGYQWELFQRAVWGWAGIGIAFTALTALLVLIIPKFESSSRWLRWTPFATLFLAGASFSIWGIDEEAWRHVSDYRGSNLLFALLLMGLAFLDTIINGSRANRPDIVKIRNRLATAAAIIFCITISTQSLVLAREVNRVSEIMETSQPGCIPESAIPGFSASPLFQSTFPATSLLLQSRNPDRIVLPDSVCESSASTGHIPMFRTPGSENVRSGWIDTWTLQYAVGGAGQCWTNFSDNWHPRENGSDGSWGRWSRGDSTIRLTVDDPKPVIFTADFRAFIPDSTVTVVLNGEELKTINVYDHFQTILPITLNLVVGDNWLELRSNQDPQNPPPSPKSLSQDPRTMTFMVWNPTFRYDTGASECTIR